MKKITHGLLTLSVLSLFCSNASAYSDEERIKDMQIMEQALQQMQKGFLYNNLKEIREGAELLKKHTARIEPPGEDGADSFKRNYAYDITKREAKKIIKLADAAVKDYKDHRPKQAMNNYTKILKQCMTCHARIRKW